MPEWARVSQDFEIPAEALEKLVAEYRRIYKEATGRDFPTDPWEQLRRAIEAVFKSWNIPRAVTYRKINKIADDLGTAVNVISMIFGNLDNDCGTGVCFTSSLRTSRKSSPLGKYSRMSIRKFDNITRKINVI